nr:hypothetical protein Iba_chr11cCG5660 [Ipomoea batatas]
MATESFLRESKLTVLHQKHRQAGIQEALFQLESPKARHDAHIFQNSHGKLDLSELGRLWIYIPQNTYWHLGRDFCQDGTE